VLLVTANAKVAFFRRLLRRGVVVELAGEFGCDLEGDVVASQESAAAGSVADDPKGPGMGAGDDVPPPGKKSSKTPLAQAGAAPPPAGKRVKKESVPDNVCRACWNLQRGKFAGVGHLYKPPCLKPVPVRGKAAGRGAVRFGAPVGPAAPVDLPALADRSAEDEL